MRVLVTGGAGFIGSCVVRRLLDRGDAVTVFDNLSTGDPNAVPDGARLVSGDVRDRGAVLEACCEHDAVVHLAAMVSVSNSIAEPDLCRAINIEGTRNVLDAVHRCGSSRVVLASTAAVYGNDPCLPKREDLVPQPVSPYAFSKWINELDARYASQFMGVEAVCLRFFNVFGPRQRPDSPYAGVISIAADRILRGHTFTVYGDGQQTRDFIYVDDVAACVVEALVRPGLRFEVVNVGSGERLPVLELLAALERAIGQPAQLAFDAERPGDVRHSVAYVGRMRSVLGVRPETPLQEGLVATIEWMRGSGA